MEVLKEKMNKPLKGMYGNKAQVVEVNECISSRHKGGKRINKKNQNCGKSRNEKFKQEPQRQVSTEYKKRKRESQTLKTG